MPEGFVEVVLRLGGAPGLPAGGEGAEALVDGADLGDAAGVLLPERFEPVGDAAAERGEVEGGGGGGHGEERKDGSKKLGGGGCGCWGRKR